MAIMSQPAVRKFREEGGRNDSSQIHTEVQKCLQ